jgi:putative flavoprotein involved in K+ transport
MIVETFRTPTSEMPADLYQEVERFDVLVIGGSQAGLAMGYYLAQQGRRFLILDGGAQVGDAWRNRYDSLTLFTPSQYNNLPGLPFPMAPDTYATKDDVADYLARYARTFALPVRLNTTVTAVEPITTGYRVRTNGATYHAEQVVVATGGFQRPYVPGISRQLDPGVFQIHSSQYKNLEQIPPGDVLVVGAGNSGAQIAAELSEDRQVYLCAGKRTKILPQRLLGKDLQWWLHTLGFMRLTAESWLARKLRGSDPIIGTDLSKLRRERGLQIAGRAERADGEHITTSDGLRLNVRNVIWATGYRPDYAWIHVPVFDGQGAPIHRRGVTSAPGLYFLGLVWQHRRGSSLLGGVGEDAAYLAEHLASRLQASIPTGQKAA